MARLRVRFTVGGLLFSVAVVAVNCWAISWLGQRSEGEMGRSGERLVAQRLGILPLANGALVGVLVLGWRHLGAARGPRRDASRSRLPAFTFFCIQFLLLYWLAGRLLAEDCDVLYRTLADSRYRALAALQGTPTISVRWILQREPVVGLFIAFTPLLASWLGCVLAHRCARTLPRWRFRMLTGLVMLGFTSVALAICLTPRRFVDGCDVAFDILVVDRSSGRPISGAFVSTAPAFAFWYWVPSRGFTDARGRARLTHRFPTRGQRNAFQTMGEFSSWGEWLAVSAVGYQTLRLPLPEVLGPAGDPTRVAFGRVRLTPGKNSEPAFREVAGRYEPSAMGFNVSLRLVIEPDGRFSYESSGCFHHSEEYGFLRRNGPEFHFIPVGRPGKEITETLTLPHRFVVWDERLHVAAERDLTEFCRLVFAANRFNLAAMGIALRVADRDRPGTELPKLPPQVWARYVNEELNLGQEEICFRLWVDSLR